MLLNLFMVARGYGQQNLMDFPNGELGGVVSLRAVGHTIRPKVIGFNMAKSPMIRRLVA